MAVVLTGAGIEQTLAGSTVVVPWADVTRVEASCVDAVTQRVAMLAFETATGECVEIGEGQSGFDAVVADLDSHLDLIVRDLSVTVAMLRTDAAVEVFARH